MTVAFEPEALIDALIAAEPSAAARRDEVRIVRAPGRVNLIGEHTDYNEGLVLPAAIDLEIRIAYLPTDDRRAEVVRLDEGERDGFDLDAPRPRAGTWLDYIVGTARALGEAGLSLTGLRGVIASTLPANAGLSSSAAIELASAWALLDSAAPASDRFRLAQLCQRAENGYVGVQSGLMDQFASSCGVAGSALLLDCRSHEWRAIPLPADIELVACHTGSTHHLGQSEYNLRRNQCDAAVAALAAIDPSVRSLRDVTSEMLRAARDRLDPIAFRRARHVVTENARVQATVAALARGDLAAVGRLFAESHASLRDEFEVSSPELDAMVEIASAVPGVVAARMTGGGFGGCTVNLVRPEAVEALRAAVLARYPARTGLTPMVFPVNAADGAGRMA
ncbi:MAG: galactokinase [Chloroflexota bacterium]